MSIPSSVRISSSLRPILSWLREHVSCDLILSLHDSSKIFRKLLIDLHCPQCTSSTFCLIYLCTGRKKKTFYIGTVSFAFQLTCLFLKITSFEWTEIFHYFFNGLTNLYMVYSISSYSINKTSPYPCPELPPTTLLHPTVVSQVYYLSTCVLPTWYYTSCLGIPAKTMNAADYKCFPDRTAYEFLSFKSPPFRPYRY